MARQGMMVGDNEHTVQNDMLEVGQKAPDFALVANDLSTKSLADYGDNVKVISVIPSIDTGVCSAQTRRFNEEAANLDNTVVLTVSADMPFALKRFCGNEGIDNTETLTTYRDMKFADDYGVHADTLTEQIQNRLRNKLMDVQSPQAFTVSPELDDFILLGAPLRVYGETVGAIVVARTKAFTNAESRLLYAMMSQIDSAVVKHRISLQLAQRNRELEAIYKIDRIRDQDSELEPMLHSVLDELCNAVNCEMGYIMIDELEKEMKKAAQDLEFEKAAALRDQIFDLRGALAEQQGAEGDLLLN